MTRSSYATYGILNTVLGTVSHGHSIGGKRVSLGSPSGTEGTTIVLQGYYYVRFSDIWRIWRLIRRPRALSRESRHRFTNVNTTRVLTLNCTFKQVRTGSFYHGKSASQMMFSRSQMLALLGGHALLMRTKYK